MISVSLKSLIYSKMCKPPAAKGEQEVWVKC